MAFKFLDRAQMTVTGTPGTGAITLNAASTGYQSFSAAGLNNGDTIPYLIVDGSNWEHGVGTYTASGTSLARTTISGSSNAGSAISATSSAIVACALRAEDLTPAPGGVAPKMVQFGYNNANGAYASVTMGAAPTNGNLLVCVVYSESAVSAGSGWSLVSQVSSGLWYCTIFTKTAGASESAAQSPLGGTSTLYWTAGIWEVSGKNAGIAIWSDEQYWNTQNGAIAYTPMMAAFPGSLCLMSFCPSVNQTYTVLNVSGEQVLDLNGSALTGAHAVYGHSDSSQAMYSMTGLMTAAAGQFNYAMVIIFS